MKITESNLTDLFKRKVGELQKEPDFQWSRDKITYSTDEGGKPEIKLAVGNVPLEYDLWEGLRNPARIGLHPAGLEDIWAYYAHKRRDSTDETGRKTIFQTPDSFEAAKDRYGRAVIISVMLPFSSKLLKDYAEQAEGNGSSHIFSKMYEDTNLMIDKATSRVAIDLVSEGNAVVAMDNRTVDELSTQAIPKTRQGEAHGPCKGGNFPQKSLAVLLGLGQFGISRLIIRDELNERGVERFMGPIRSIVVFDRDEPVGDCSGGVIRPNDNWREFLVDLFDFTNPDPDLNDYRYCSYLSGDVSCGKCRESCPSGAQKNSTPKPEGSYSSEIENQTHRFWNDQLQFDFAQCCEKRGQMNDLFPEWSCAHCLATCATEGVRNKEKVKNFQSKSHQLLKVE
ncbi:MAG: hypothetical protein ABEI54_02495 [Candidatus Bipolaricaulia bacterium]